MKHHISILDLAYLIVTSSTIAFSQWSHIGPDCGTVATIGALQKNDGAVKLFAGMSGDWLFVSTDLGGNWQRLSTSVTQGTSDGITTFVVLGPYIFGGSKGGGGVWRSSDEGASWEWTGNGLKSQFVYSLAILGESLIVGMYDGAYRSTDYGETWTRLTDPVPSRFGGLIVTSGTKIFAAAGKTIFVSSDTGSSWTSICPNIFEPVCHSLAVCGSKILAASNEALFMSTDSGMNWTQCNTGVSQTVMPILLFTIGIHGDTTFFYSAQDLMGQNCGVLRSTDAGASWESSNSGLYDKSVNDISVYSDDSGSTVLFASTGRVGIYRSTDNGASWHQANSGFYCAPTPALAVQDTFLFVGVAGRGVLRTVDNGNTWVPLGMSDTWTTMAVTDSAIFRGNQLKGTLSRSTDNGETWTQISEASNTVTSIAALPDESGNKIVLVGSNGSGVYLSSDNGAHWTWADRGGSGGVVLGFVRCFTACGSTFFVGSDSGLYRMSHEDAGWNVRTTGISGRSVTSALCSIGFAGDTSLFAGTDNGILVSTNGGNDWSDSRSESQFGRVNCILEATDKSRTKGIFAGTSNGLFRFSGIDTTWISESLEWSEGAIQSLAVSGDDLIADGVRGLWRRPLSVLIITEAVPHPDIPNGYRLDQNYPNPFNPSTTIRYTIAGSREYGVGSKETKLVVCDILGREVAVLVNERKAPGSYEVRFDGSNLASGVYFYRLQAGDFVQVRELLLLK